MGWRSKSSCSRPRSGYGFSTFSTSSRTLSGAPDKTLSLHEAALHGSSHYDLPAVLRWFTANIGVQHVHHLCSRYRLSQVLRDYPELDAVGRLTLTKSLGCVRLVL
jgi:acyl-lipid omega-6 desaturase (Delta-12 desaturase)